MIESIENFLLNKFAGKIIARAAVTLAGYLASGALGASVNIDPNELTALGIAGAHAVFEWIKARRMKNPASAAVQTDATVKA